MRRLVLNQPRNPDPIPSQLHIVFRQGKKSLTASTLTNEVFPAFCKPTIVTSISVAQKTHSNQSHNQVKKPAILKIMNSLSFLGNAVLAIIARPESLLAQHKSEIMSISCVSRVVSNEI